MATKRLVGIVNASGLPSRLKSTESALRSHWPAKGTSVIVWFGSRGWRAYFLSIEELKEFADIDEVAHFSDGSVYRVSVRNTAAPY
jgi:hypothetical protein